MNQLKQKGAAAIVALIVVLLWLAAVVGWVWNIVKIVGIASDPITGMFIIRCIGVIVAPVGAVLGYI